MKRWSGKVGKRSVRPGLTTPEKAIWSVIQNGLSPATCFIMRVKSPTMLSSLFFSSECTPGG
jgi:hypothetical protein